MPIVLLESDPIEILGFGKKLTNFLKRGGVFDIGDLFKFSRTRLLRIKNIGPKNLKILLHAKENLNSGKEISIVRAHHKSKNIDLIQSLLSRCRNPRSLEILNKIYGLTGERCSLEKVGAELRLSRQRVSQIKKAGLIEINNVPTELKKILLEKIEQIFSKKGGIINNRDADKAFIKMFKDIYRGGNFLNLLGDIGWIQAFNSGLTTYYCSKSEVIDLKKLVMKYFVPSRNKSNLKNLGIYKLRTPDLCKALGVTRWTLIRWEKERRFTPPRDIGNQRIFTEGQIKEIIDAFSPEGPKQWHFKNGRNSIN